MANLGTITITDTETGTVETSRVLSFEEGMKKMEDILQNTMTTIINIQNMEKIIILGNPHTFNELESMSGDELRELQNELIPLYNDAVRKDS